MYSLCLLILLVAVVVIYRTSLGVVKSIFQCSKPLSRKKPYHKAAEIFVGTLFIVATINASYNRSNAQNGPGEKFWSVQHCMILIPPPPLLPLFSPSFLPLVPFRRLHTPQGLEGIHEGEYGGGGGGGLGRGRSRRMSAEGGPRDQINGSVLDLRPSTVSAQVQQSETCYVAHEIGTGD